jgi:acylphosphatase
MVEIQCLVTGKVQGVSYRAYVQDSATELELVGYVRNNPDGTVTVVAQGTPDVLKSFVEYLHEGSLLAVVEGVSVEWGSPHTTYTEFSILM